MRKVTRMISEKMTEKDIPEVAELLGDAFANKFTDVVPLSKQTAKKLMKLLWLEEANVFGMQPYVLKEGEEVVAAFGVTASKKGQVTLSFIAKVSAVVRKIGLKHLITFARVGLETSRMPDRDERYIDFIAVKRSRRNENIGHQVMEEIDELKVTEPGIKKLSLYVLKENGRARHLYTKYGFKPSARNLKSNYLFMVKN